MNIAPRLQTGLLTLLAALFLSAGLGLRDPWPPDEPRYILVATEMVASGQWLLPTRGGEIYPDKPPIFMWAEAVVYSLTGSVHLAFELPSLLAALATLWLVYSCGRALWDHRTGLVAAGLLFCTFQFLKQSTDGQIDSLLCFWTTLGATGLLRHYLRGPAPGWLYLATLACGLGVLTKGVGFLPLLIIPLAAVYRRFGHAPAAVSPPLVAGQRVLATGAFLLPLLAWVAPLLVLAQGNPAIAAYRDNILLHQTLGRYSHPWGHFKPPWYYLVHVIPLNWMSLSALLPFALPEWWRRGRSEPRFWLPLAWVVLLLLFFSASPGKRDIYIYPALPAVALALAPLLETLAARRGVQWLCYLLASGLTLALLATWAVTLGWFRVQHDLEISVSAFSPLFAWVSAAALVTGTLFRRRRAYLWLSAILLSSWLAYRLLATPALNDLLSSRGLLQEVNVQMGQQSELGIAGWHEQTLLQARLLRAAEPALFGFGSATPEDWQAALDWLQAEPSRRLLFPETSLQACLEVERAEDMGVYHRSRWWLASRRALAPDCRVITQTYGDRP